MQVLDYILKANDGQAIANLAASFGLTQDEAERAVKAVAPQLASSIERNTLSRGGLADLISALGDGRHSAYLGGRVPLDDPRLREDGNNILGHLVGTKDASRGIAQRAAAESGLSSSLIRMLLPIIAGMIMGGLSNKTSGGLGDILSKMGLPVPGSGGGGSGSGSPRGGYEMPRLPEMPSGGGIPLPGDRSGSGGGPGFPMPSGAGRGTGGSGGWPNDDTNVSGFPSPRDGGGFPFPGGARGGGAPSGDVGSQSPLPLPGDMPGLPRNERNPYEDLSDILRRGGFGGGGGGARPGGGTSTDGSGGSVNLPGASGSMLWQIIRSVLGGALGFGNRGLTGWIFNFLLMRFAWPILKSILGGVLRGGR